MKEPCIPGAMKNRMEHETVLGASMGQAMELFRVLGYHPVRRYFKEREIWVLPGLGKVCLDGLPFGCFIEIEANTPRVFRGMPNTWPGCFRGLFRELHCP